MTYQQRLETELNKLVGVTGSHLPVVNVNLQHGELSLELQSVDQLACAMLRLSVRSDKLSACSMEQLQQIAEDLSDRLSYLLERISPIEIDQEACVVQMRSNPPQQDDDGTRYYELVVERGALSLCRFEKAPGKTRSTVAANVTREVVGRLARDFAAVRPADELRTAN